VIIKSFDGLALLQHQMLDSLPVEFFTALQGLPGLAGAFDHYGDEQHRQPVTITRRFILVSTSGNDVGAQLDALRAKANLGRRWLVVETVGGAERGTWAKLIRVNAQFGWDQIRHLPVNLDFQVTWPWFEDADDIWYLDAGEALDDGLTFDSNYSTRSGAGSLVITNTGGDVIRRGLIVVKGTSANPTITNNANGWSIAYAGTIPAGSTLVIDFGAQTATVDGESVWGSITLGTTQTGIFKLNTGENLIDFTGGGTLEIHWAEVY
jgi:hypothetical protein